MSARQANCPSCGALITFKAGNSVVIVCPYCRSAVARTDLGLEDLGKVAELIETGSPLSVGLTGRYNGIAFELMGRAQLGHSAGGVWDEWYAAFTDGRWGWLAEAQGKFYLTFEKSPDTASSAPPFEALQLGAPVPGLRTQVLFMVAEKGEAQTLGAVGEIPWRLVPGETYLYADLSAADGKFGTLDYSDTPPLLFLGEEVTLAELGIRAAPSAPRERRVTATALPCPKCAGPLELRAPDQSERVICPYCDSLLDVNQGQLQYFKTLKQKKLQPKLPLGSTGEFEGVPLTVVGFMQRSVRFDRKYYWEEYLLYHPQVGFRWLVNSDDHWNYVITVPPGNIQDGKKSLRYQGRTFKLYQDTEAQVECVYGEFYWKVQAGEKVQAADYIAPPDMISREVTKAEERTVTGRKTLGEVNYSLGTYVPRREIEAKFKVEDLPRPKTVAPNQPFPHKGIYVTWGLLTLLTLVVGIFLILWGTVTSRTVLTQTYELAALPNADATQIVFTDPFELQGRRNVRVEASAPIDNTYVSVVGDLINEETGLVQPFYLPLEYYYGVDGGESWSEGNRKQSDYVSALPAGRYTMRLEAQWERWQQPVTLTIKVEQGVPRFWHLLVALIVLAIIPGFVMFQHFSFEKRRWQDSDYSPYS